MNWKEGDIAICVKVGHLNTTEGKNPPLRLNLEYVVHAVYQCPKCKVISLDVGLASSSDSGVRCCSEMIPCKEVWWCCSNRFVKKDLRSKEEQIAEAVQNENYELAEQIRTLQK